MAMKKIGAIIALDGEKAYKSAIRTCNSETKKFQAELEGINAKYKGNVSNVTSLTAKLKVLGNALNSTKEKVEHYRNAMRLQGQVIEQGKERIEQLNLELKSNRAELKALAETGTTSGNAYRKLSEKVENTERKLQSANVQYNNAVTAFNNLERELTEATTDFNRLEREIDDNERALKTESSAIRRLVSSFHALHSSSKSASDTIGEFKSRVASMLSVYTIVNGIQTLYYSVQRFGGAVIEAGMAFESSMSNVKALSGATAVEMEQLSSAAQSLAATTKFTASEVSDALGYMALAGWNAEQMLAGLPGVTYLGAAANMDLAEASDILTDAMTALSDEAEDAIRYADVLARTQASTNTTVSQLGEAYKYCAATAGMYGYEIEDLTSALGLMANAAIKGSSAGTYLSMIISRLGTNTSHARDAAEELGVQFYDTATGSARPLRDVLYELISALQGCNDETRAAVINTIAGKRASEGLAALVNQGADAYNNLTIALDNCAGSAEEIQGIMMDNLEGDTLILKSALEALGITAYDAFENGLRSSAQQATTEVNKLNNQIKSGSGIGKSIKELGKAFEQNGAKITKMVISVMEGFVKAGIFIVNNIDHIVSAIKVLIASFAAYKVAVLASAIATEGFLKTFALTPVGAISVALIGIATGFAEIYKSAGMASGYTNEFVNSVNECIDACEAQTEANKALTASWNDSVASAEAQSETARNLTDELFKIQTSTLETSAKQQEMSRIVAELNSLIPNLNLALIDENGTLNMQKDAIMKVVTANEAYAKSVAAQEMLVEISKEMVNTKIELYKAEEKLKDVETSMGSSRQKTLLELDKESKLHRESSDAVKNLEESYSELEGEYQSILGFMGTLEEQTGQTTDEIIASGDAVASSAEETEGVISELQESISSSVEGILTSFQVMEQGESMSLAEMQANMESNIAATTEWSANLQKLAQAGVNDGLLKTLAEAGPQSLLLVRELASNLQDGQMNDALQQYSNSWAENTDLADTISTNLSTSIEALSTGSSGITDAAGTAGQASAESFTTEFSTSVESKSGEMADAVNSSVENAYSGASESASAQGQEVANAGVESTVNAINDGNKNVQNAVTNVSTNAYLRANASMQASSYVTIGARIPSGLAKGITAGESVVINAVATLCAKAIAEANSKMQIKSPSRVFAKIGAYTIQGFVKGVNDNSNLATEAISNAMDFRISPKIPNVYQQLGSNLSGSIGSLEKILPKAIVQALADSGLSFQCGEYEFGKLVRSVV